LIIAVDGHARGGCPDGMPGYTMPAHGRDRASLCVLQRTVMGIMG
jgi:hypothetical protein